MIICKTPLRISFLGGSTDYLPHIKSGNPGLVLGTTIDKYIWILCRYLPQFFEYKTQLSYSAVECVQSNHEIIHNPARSVIEYLGLEDGLEISHHADIPSKTGMGSSSSFLVCMLHSLMELQRRIYTKSMLYSSAVHIEQNILKESVGLQDSAWATFGGLNFINFEENTGITKVNPIILPIPILEELQNNLLLFYTGFNRVASDVAGTYVNSLTNKKEQLKQLYSVAEKGIEALESHNIDRLGELLHENWSYKKQLSTSISSPVVDEIYDIAINAGALGGKLLGAGKSGCMLFYVPREKRHLVRQSLEGVVKTEIPFRFDISGSSVVFNGNKNG